MHVCRGQRTTSGVAPQVLSTSHLAYMVYLCVRVCDGALVGSGTNSGFSVSMAPHFVQTSLLLRSAG